MDLADKDFSALTALPTMSSSSPSRVSLWMALSKSLSLPSTSVPSSARMAKKLGVSRVISQLSSDPELWSAHLLSASGFSMVFPGL
jgi:hypothetical protein